MTPEGAELIAAVEAALPGWIDACVARVSERGDIDTRPAASAAVADVVPRLRALLERDYAQQAGNPLQILRGAVSFPTAVLRELGVAPLERDEMAQQLFPEDLYDLVPSAFADFGPEVHDAGLRWGAAKAFAHLQARRVHPR